MVLHYVNSIDFFPSITVNHCEKIAFQVDGFTLNLIILIIPQTIAVYSIRTSQEILNLCTHMGTPESQTDTETAAPQLAV